MSRPGKAAAGRGTLVPVTDERPGGRRRDRHGRGLRGRLLSPVARPRADGPEIAVPAWRSRQERFDDLVRDAVEALSQRWGHALALVEIGVEDVPDTRLGRLPLHGVVADETAGGPVPLGLVIPGTPERSGRLVVFRRPVEARGEDLADLAGLVHEVVVDLVAELLGLSPDEVDPGYR